MICKGLGLFKKYSVTKINNPDKSVDAIVLEFDDPIARKAIRYWGKVMGENGYEQVEYDVNQKLDAIEEELGDE